jgi:hypothetical protein
MFTLLAQGELVVSPLLDYGVPALAMLSVLLIARMLQLQTKSWTEQSKAWTQNAQQLAGLFATEQNASQDLRTTLRELSNNIREQVEVQKQRAKEEREFRELMEARDIRDQRLLTHLVDVNNTQIDAIQSLATSSQEATKIMRDGNEKLRQLILAVSADIRALHILTEDAHAENRQTLAELKSQIQQSIALLQNIDRTLSVDEESEDPDESDA